MTFLDLNGTLQCYADDAVLMHSSSNIFNLIDEMQQDLLQIQIWLSRNNLKVNTKKLST